MKKYFKKKIIIAVCALLAAVFFICGIDNNLTVTYYNIKSEKIENSVRICFLSDLHGSVYGENQSEIIAKVEKENPDIVVFGGDIFESTYETENSQTMTESFAKKYKCYFVTGNHEFWGGDSEEITDFFENAGVKVLRGEGENIDIRGKSLNIFGIDDAKDTAGAKKQLSCAKAVCDNGNFSVLLAHRPEYIDEYLKYGFDLVLSGHTHGGQWRLPFFDIGLYAYGQGLFPKYSGGKYEFINSALIVGRGLCKNTAVMRLYNPPEIVIVNIYSM